MIKLDIKPLSANEMYLGRKVKSQAYRKYETKMMQILPNNITVTQKRLKLMIRVGLSSKLADLDNVLKPFIDCLQMKYSFNDKYIYKLITEKEDVNKGEEYIMFSIREMG